MADSDVSYRKYDDDPEEVIAGKRIRERLYDSDCKFASLDAALEAQLEPPVQREEGYEKVVIVDNVPVVDGK